MNETENFSLAERLKATEDLKFVVKVDPVSRIKKLEERDSFRYRVLFISVLSFCGILQG